MKGTLKESLLILVNFRDFLMLFQVVYLDLRSYPRDGMLQFLRKLLHNIRVESLLVLVKVSVREGRMVTFFFCFVFKDTLNLYRRICQYLLN